MSAPIVRCRNCGRTFPADPASIDAHVAEHVEFDRMSKEQDPKYKGTEFPLTLESPIAGSWDRIAAAYDDYFRKTMGWGER